MFLRSALRDYLTDDLAATGFVLRVPAQRSGFYLVLDRSGWVLGRTRSVEGSVAILASHLAALLPPPPETTRLRMRALVGDSGLVVASFPHFTTPPAIEGRLARSGHRILDRLAVDVTADLDVVTSPVPWSNLMVDDGVLGHQSVLATSTRVRSAVIAGRPDDEPTRAGLVALFASALSASELDLVIDRAERLAALPVAVIDVADGVAVHDALR